LFNKYIKCNFGGQRCGTSTIVDVRRLKVKTELQLTTNSPILKYSWPKKMWKSYQKFRHRI